MDSGRSDKGEAPDDLPDDPVNFENFGPAEMRKLSPDEWEEAFDPDSWITGRELIGRVERDLKSRIAFRDLFANVRLLTDNRLLVYSDNGYAIVKPDGSVTGDGTIYDEVTTSVVLCAMDDYDVPDPPTDWALPKPEAVQERSGELGNIMMQVLAVGLLLAGIVMIVSAAIGVAGRAPIILVIIGFLFLAGSIVLLVIVANARLSARFRAEEYRDRLRRIHAGTNTVPSFVPIDHDELLYPDDSVPPESNSEPT